MGKFIDLIGQKYNRLTIINQGLNSEYGNSYWWCICDCGNRVLIRGAHLTQGRIQSCGCLHDEESLERIQEWNQKDRAGEKSPNWNPNLTDEERESNRSYLEYKMWRTAVYEQDMHTCQKCANATGGNLIAHHKISYADNPELRTKVSNGITLCESCHLNFHHQYGYGNNTREQLNKFLSEDK